MPDNIKQNESVGASNAENINADNTETNESRTNESPKSWFEGIEDESLRGYAEQKGWDNPTKALTAYKNFEEIMDMKELGKTLVLPKDSEDKEALEKIYSKLGKPKTAEEYNLLQYFNEEEVDPEFMGAMASVMHEAGLNQKQAEGISKRYKEIADNMQQVTKEANEVALNKLKNDWGADYDKNVDIASAGARIGKLNNETISRLENAVGAYALMDYFYEVGLLLNEDSTMQGMNKTSTTSGQGEIDRLLSDPHFAERYQDGDSGAVQTITNLYKKMSRKK